MTATTVLERFVLVLDDLLEELAWVRVQLSHEEGHREPEDLGAAQAAAESFRVAFEAVSRARHDAQEVLRQTGSGRNLGSDLESAIATWMETAKGQIGQTWSTLFQVEALLESREGLAASKKKRPLWRGAQQSA